MASAPAASVAVGLDKPSLFPGTTYRLALFTKDKSKSRLDVVLTGSTGEAKVSLIDVGSNCRRVWSSHAGAAHDAADNQIDVYDLSVSDVGDLSSLRLEWDLESAKRLGGIGVDDYNFNYVQVLRASGMRVLLFTNPPPQKSLGKDNRSVQMNAGQLPPGTVAAVALPTVMQAPQSPPAAGGGAASANVGSAPISTDAASTPTTFIVGVRTKNELGAGTDGRVSIKFHGGQGGQQVETPIFELDQLKIQSEDFHRDSFEGGDNPNPEKEVIWRKEGKFFETSQESLFRIVIPLPDNFGMISAVTVYHDPPRNKVGFEDVWVPKFVSVNQYGGDPESSVTRYFNFPENTKMNSKLMSFHIKDFKDEKKKRGDGLATKALKQTVNIVSVAVQSVVPAVLVRPKKNWEEKSKEYVIEVKTGSKMGAGTDCDVEVVLCGNVREYTAVLKEHPLNPARLEAEEPGKDLFEQHNLDRFIISIPAAVAVGDQITKIKVRLLNQKPDWDKSQGAMSSGKEAFGTMMAVVTRDEWKPAYIRIVDYEKPEGQNEFYFDLSSVVFTRDGKHKEITKSIPVEVVPDVTRIQTEEHDFVHIHDTNDPGVEKPEPQGFFGFGKKKEEADKKDEADKQSKEQDEGSTKLPAKVGEAEAAKPRRQSVIDKVGSAAKGLVGAKDKDADAKDASNVAEEEPEKGLGDEDDADPDSPEQAAPKEILKIPSQEEKKTIEKGPYRVYVQISEGRDLVGKKENLMAEPVFQVSACGQKELSRNKKKKCRSLFVNQLFIFDFEQKELFDMDLAKIQISYLDGGSLFSTLLGSYEFDMSIIYHQDKHEIANVWVALLDSSGESLDIKGFVKLSIAVVGENDELPVHNDDDEDEEAGMDMTQCLMPPNMETKKNSLTIVCLKGQGFPQLSTSNMEFFAEAAFGAKRARTVKDRNKLSPEWNEALRLPFVTPTMSNDISISFKNSRKGGKNQTCGTLHVSLKDVFATFSPDGNLIKPSKYYKPKWFNIYGTPLEIQRETKFELGPLQSDFAKIINQSNKGLTVGSSFCGRVLLAIEAREDSTAFRSVKGQIIASLHKQLIVPTPPQKPLLLPTYYKCRIVLHEGCQFKSDYVVVKAMFGSKTRQTDICTKNTDTGSFDFYRQPNPKLAECCFPGDLHMKGSFTEEDGDGTGAFDPVNGLPDIIIEIWNKKKTSRLGFARVPAAECRGTNKPAQWISLTKCPFSTLSGFPGFLLASINVEQSGKFQGDLAVYKPADVPPRSEYWLVSHVYMARSLPSADPNGLSDPYVEIYCGGSKAVSSVRPETLNPVWYENMKTKVILPTNKSIRRPISVMVWDQDFGSAALPSLFSDDFLGSVDVSWKDAFGARFTTGDMHNYAEPASWISLTDPVDGSKSGEILLSFQLFPIAEDGKASAAGDMNIVPEFIRDCQLQITALGCRNLAPFGIRSVNNSLLEFDLAASTSTVSAKGPKGKKKKVPKVAQLLRTKRVNVPSGSDPNFSHTFNVNVNVPLNPLFAPIITIRCIDSWLFGLKTPMVGTGRIVLESLVQPLLAANKLSPSDRGAPPKSERAALAVEDFIQLGETVQVSFGDGLDKRLQFIIEFPHYPPDGAKYWPAVLINEPWAQWVKEQKEQSIPMSGRIKDKDFKRSLWNLHKILNLPLPSLPHTGTRLIASLFGYCISVERIKVQIENDRIDAHNSRPSTTDDQKLQPVKVIDVSSYEVPQDPILETSAMTAHTVWSAFAVPHPSKLSEHMVRLYQLPSMLSSFGLDSDDSYLLRKCYEHRWLGIPQKWDEKIASAGKDSPTSSIDFDTLVNLTREVLSAASPQGATFEQQHFAIYQNLCSMTISLDVFFDFVFFRIYADLDIDGDKHIDLKESQRLLERLGYPCSFDIVKKHYSSLLNVPESSLQSMFNFDQVKGMYGSVKASAIANASGAELVRASYGSDVSTEIISGRGSAGVGGGAALELKVLNPTTAKGNEKEEAPLDTTDTLIGRGKALLDAAAETEKEEDDVMPYMRGRATINEALENPKYIGESPFSTFRLTRGQKKGGFFAKLVGGGEEFEAGVFKGCVTLLAPKGSELQKSIETAPPNAAIRRFFPEVPKAPNVQPKQVVVRLYILKGYNMFCEDDSNLYLRVKLGKNVIQDSGKVCKGNNQLEFYQSFELRVELPGVSQLEVSVVERNFFGFDAVIGTTTLDLEDRWFNEKWSKGSIDIPKEANSPKEVDEKLSSLKRKPVEERTLKLPSNRMPQGKITCWLDMMTEKEAAKEPMFDISLVPPAPFELRLVLWKGRNMMSMEELTKGMNDLYLVASLISLGGLDIEKETDIHWRAKNGTGSFNWRMKFNFTLPQKRPRLRISAWDQDIFGSNDAIGESQLPLTKIFKQAWKAYCAKVRPDPLAAAASAAKSKDGKSKGPPSSSKNIIEYPPKPEKGDVAVATELNDEPAWVKLNRKDKETGLTVAGGEVAFQLALMEQSVADARPVGDERKEPNRDPQLPSPDRVRWSLLHPWDMLLDILGPDLYRKFKAALCVICCCSIIITLAIFVGPLVTGNVLGAVAAKP